MRSLSKSISNRAFSLWSLIIAIEGILVVYFIAREPSEEESIFAFGLSLQLLLIVISIIVVALFFSGVSIAHFYQRVLWNEFLNKRPIFVQYLLSAAFILAIAFLHLWLLFPDYHFPTLSGYISRLEPVLVWVVLIFVQTFIFLVYFRGLSFKDLKNWRENVPVLVAIVIMLVAWGVIAKTKIGITPDALYWNMAGVPLLAGQVWIATAVTLVSWIAYNQFAAQEKNPNQIPSIVVFTGIWVVAAFVWVKTPLAPSFNAPGPYLPTKGFYPFVDAAFYDLGAQSVIYGNGINFGNFIDRGLLMGFLAILHMLFGQNYLLVVGVQSAIFATFPALLYLLGEKLHSKAAGLMIAALATFKVSNAISGGKWLSTSHPKLILTEFPTGIVLVVFSLLLVKWLEESKSKSYVLAGVGASIGIGILIRQNVFFMVPVTLVLGAIAVWKLNWKLALRDILLFAAAFFITISPWMWRNQRVAGEPLFFLQQFNNVIEERYQPQSNLDQNRIVLTQPSRALRNSTIISRIEKDNIFDQYQFIPKHFVHNIITSVLILPPSPVLDDLRHVVDNYPYWNRMTTPWTRQNSFSTGIFLAVNLILLSIGFGSAWKRLGLISLVPLAVFLFYNLANAFARTSGGRYVVPVDWVVYFYYAVGLVTIIRFCISMLGFQPGTFFTKTRNYDRTKVNRQFYWGRAFLTILPFFLIVAALPIMELTSSGKAQAETTETLIQQLDETAFFDTTGLSRSELEEFLINPDSILIAGHGLYPRYYSYEEGEPLLPSTATVYSPRDYPRLIFSLILPNTHRPILLPIDEPRLYFPDGVEAIVGGCQVGDSKNLAPYLNYIDASFVVILDETETIYLRVPDAPLNCPIPEPVCDNNHHCN
ncbi:MAG: hypothetical protein PVJ21_08290 [Anaerolineales bacterium]